MVSSPRAVSGSTWRITQQKHVQAAFTGEGARLYGGRWNSPGVPVVYLAQSRSLAILGVLVPLEAQAFLAEYSFIEATFARALVKMLERETLPEDWRSDPVPRSTQRIGDGWALSGESAVLQVPSVLVPEESNFLLNPRHPAFQKIGLSKPRPFRFDPRLKRR